RVFYREHRRHDPVTGKVKAWNTDWGIIASRELAGLVSVDEAHIRPEQCSCLIPGVRVEFEYKAGSEHDECDYRTRWGSRRRVASHITKGLAVIGRLRVAVYLDHHGADEAVGRVAVVRLVKHFRCEPKASESATDRSSTLLPAT